MSEQEPREYYWVPEQYLFFSAQDCLGAFPDAGPACLVASHVAYDALKAKVESMEEEHKIWEKHSLCQLVKERDALEAENEELRAQVGRQ